MSGQRQANLTAVSQTSGEPLTAKAIDVSIRGTFVATWAIKRRVAGQEDIVETGTGAYSGTVENGAPRPTWIECTAHTSGTLEVALEG